MPLPFLSMMLDANIFIWIFWCLLGQDCLSWWLFKSILCCREGEKTKLMIVQEKQKVVEKEAETDRKRAIIGKLIGLKVTIIRIPVSSFTGLGCSNVPLGIWSFLYFFQACFLYSVSSFFNRLIEYQYLHWAMREDFKFKARLVNNKPPTLNTINTKSGMGKIKHKQNIFVVTGSTFCRVKARLHGNFVYRRNC